MQSRKFYVKDILTLAAPIIMGNIGFIMIGVGDVIVAGRHSTDTLAAISLATAITNCLMMFGIGVLCSMSAVLSNYRGEKKSVETYFIPSLKFAFILACITSSLIFGTIPLIDKIGFPPNLVPMIKEYFFITGFATFGGYLHCVTKEFLQSFEIVIFPNIITIFCIFLNLALNIVLVFGFGPVKEMGVAGLAIASLIVRYFMGIVLLIYTCFRLKVGTNTDFKYYKDMLKVGLPSSFAIMVEFVGFNIIAVVMGRVSGIYAAAHNLICTLTNVAFMVPLAISNATAVKVGFANGARFYKSLKKYAYTGMKMSVCFMAFAATFIGLNAEFIMKLFTHDSELIKICVPIVYVLCFFQMFDGLQVSLAGIFKGIKKTTVVLFSNILGYWFIAFPLGYYFAFKLKLNLIGFWYAIAISSVVLCSIMLIFMVRKFKKLEG